MKCFDVIRLSAKEAKIGKSKLLLGFFLWISLLTVSFCIYRFSFSFRDNLYQYLAKYDPSIASVDFVTEDPLGDLEKFHQIGMQDQDILMFIKGNPHLKFHKEDGTEIQIPCNNITAERVTDTNETASPLHDGRYLTQGDDTKESNAVVISSQLAKEYALKVGDCVTASVSKKMLRSFVVCGIVDNAWNDMQFPIQPFLAMTEHSGLYIYAYVTVNVNEPSTYYDLKAFLDQKGIILISEFEQAFELIEIVSEAFWMISVICMLLAVFSMINYCSIFVSERREFIILLKTLGTKNISVSSIFYFILMGLFLLAFIVAMLLQWVVYLHFQTVYTSILHVSLHSTDHFGLFVLICFLIDFIFVSIAFHAKIGKMICSEDISAMRLQDD